MTLAATTARAQANPSPPDTTATFESASVPLRIELTRGASWLTECTTPCVRHVPAGVYRLSVPRRAAGAVDDDNATALTGSESRAGTMAGLFIRPRTITIRPDGSLFVLHPGSSSTFDTGTAFLGIGVALVAAAVATFAAGLRRENCFVLCVGLDRGFGDAAATFAFTAMGAFVAGAITRALSHGHIDPHERVRPTLTE